MQNTRSETELLPIVVQENHVLVDAVLLHSQLQVKTKFSDWIKSRITRFGFEIDRDYFTETSEKLGAGRKGLNYFVSIDMVKELAMLEENEEGRKIRKYRANASKLLVGCEKASLHVVVAKSCDECNAVLF